MIRQLYRHPSVRRGLDWLWQVAGGVSIQTKILGIVLGLTTLLGLSVTWQVRNQMSYALLNELERLGNSVVSDLAFRSAGPLSRNSTAELQQLLLETVANHPDTRYAFVVGANGEVLAQTFSQSVPSEVLTLSPHDEGELGHHLHYENVEGRIHDFAAPIVDGGGAVARVGLAEIRLQATINSTTRRMLLTTALVGLVGVGTASLLTWLLTRPILDLVAATQRVRQGDLGARAPHWADDEIGDLADAFNQLMAELEVSQQTVAEKEAARGRLLAQLINAQEEERKRIARDLHDGVGQALTSLLVNLKLMSQSDRLAGAKDKVEEMRQVASETLEDVRLLSRQLRPSALDDLGLAAALDRYVAEFMQRYPHLTVDLHTDLPDRLPPAVETSLYRIVQEAMTNAARHSQASDLSVLVTRRNGSVQAILEDNGRGFDPVAARRSGTSVGLHGMAERVDLFGGRLEIESSPEGTSIYVEIPL